MQDLFDSQIPWDHIVNCDETSWKLFPNGLLTWADSGSDNVQTIVQGNTKDSITALATISAANTKLPLFIIAKGETERVEKSQLGDTVYHIPSHSSTGWTTIDTFKQYLDFLSEHFNHEPVHLILDVYAVHRNEEIKEYAKNLGIQMYFIPAGLTDKFQPLDRRVFGCLKATARHIFYEQMLENPEMEFTKQKAVESLIYSWEHLSQEVIEDAWSIYLDDE